MPRTPVRARHAKGVNLVDLVKLLRVARREGRLDDVPAADAALLEERILMSSWYRVEDFWRLLTLCHDRVLGGSDEAAITMGSMAAESVLSSVHSSFVKRDDLERSLRTVERAWSSYFDFGSIEVNVEGDVARLRILDFSEMPRVHGFVTLGWFRTALALAGYEVRYSKIVSEPWAGDDEFVIEFGLPPGTGSSIRPPPG